MLFVLERLFPWRNIRYQTVAYVKHFLTLNVERFTGMCNQPQLLTLNLCYECEICTSCGLLELESVFDDSCTLVLWKPMVLCQNNLIVWWIPEIWRCTRLLWCKDTLWQWLSEHAALSDVFCQQYKKIIQLMYPAGIIWSNDHTLKVVNWEATSALIWSSRNVLFKVVTSLK